MAKKDTKLEEIRVRIPKEYKSILDEYCDTFGTTIQATLFAAICGHIAADLWNALARTREVVVKLNNFTPNYSPPSQNSEKSSLKRLLIILRKKEQSKYPMTLTHHGRYPRRMDSTTRKRWPRSWIGRYGGKVYADWIATYRNACRGWLPSKFEGARKQLHQGVKVI